jgi:hypothetical protein
MVPPHFAEHVWQENNPYTFARQILITPAAQHRPQYVTLLLMRDRTFIDDGSHNAGICPLLPPVTPMRTEFRLPDCFVSAFLKEPAYYFAIKNLSPICQISISRGQYIAGNLVSDIDESHQHLLE